MGKDQGGGSPRIMEMPRIDHGIKMYAVTICFQPQTTVEYLTRIAHSEHNVPPFVTVEGVAD